MLNSDICENHHSTLQLTEFCGKLKNYWPLNGDNILGEKNIKIA